MGDSVTLIDSGAAAADFAFEFLKESDMLNEEKTGEQAYYVSDSTEEFARLGGMFLNRPIEKNVGKVDIERY